MERLNNLACNYGGRIYSPDLTFIINVPVESGLKNAGERGELNRLDKESSEFHERVRNGFLEIARNNPERVVLIPYQDGIEKVQGNIRARFSERYL